MSTQRQPAQDITLERAAQDLAGHALPWMMAARQSALARFAAQGLPDRREEEWKYTDVSVLGRRASLAPQPAPTVPALDAALHDSALPSAGMQRMVFVDGHYCAELSRIVDLPPGVRLLSLAQMLDSGAELPRQLFEQEHEHTIFATLNNALASDGAVLLLAPDAVLETPLYLVFVASGGDVTSYPRNLVMAAAGARGTLIEHYLGTPETHSFTNALTQLSLDPGAEIAHYKLLQEGAAAVHIAGIHAQQAASSRFSSHSFALGGRLGRNDITVRLQGAGSQCTLNGLYLLDGRQHMDHHTRIDHLAPECRSREYYRGVLDGAARGVFNGKVVVHPGAVKTDAHQSNRNLLLSRQAEVDTKPQLEIFADDVVCTHGATVGQLDEEALFYLRSRGIDAETARALLIYGFAQEIIEKIEVPALRARIEQLVLERLPLTEPVKELL